MKHSIHEKYYWPAIIAMGIVAMLVILSLFVGLLAFFPLPQEWFNAAVLTVGYPVQLFSPIVLFALMYAMHRKENTTTRLYVSALFLAVFFWIRTLIEFGAMQFVSQQTDQYISVVIQSVLPNIAAIVVLFFAIILSRSKQTRNRIVENKLLWCIFALLIIVVSGIQLVTNLTGNMQSLLQVYSLVVLITPLLTIGVGYYTYAFGSKKLNTSLRLQYTIVAMTIVSFSATSWIYFFGGMKLEGALLVTGMVASVIGALLFTSYADEKTTKQ